MIALLLVAGVLASPHAELLKAARRAPVIPGVAVKYVQGTAPGLEAPEYGMSTAAYMPDSNTVYYQGAKLDPTIRGHESGHAFDHQILSDGDRHFFARLMGLKGAWNQGTGLTAGGLASPNENFADWYGNAVNHHDAAHSWDSAYASAPDPRKFRQFEQALGRLGQRRHLSAYV